MPYKCKEKQREAAKLWRKNNRERMAEVQKRWHEENREKSRKATREWRARNPDKVWEYNATTYSSAILPDVHRILEIAERMNDSQKGRFADWLLNRGHRCLKHFWVDSFVADFNTQGI